ncbi:uncharacterized protein APUU_40339S [Aspergillus puulaauensis]|uniref:Uncharacterized protein n=1 Tax=Aspergillus puulaauensis TaxID=1220207 RepID=A0A7R7XM13_9EURO|nr:uncharacterized protein APUU_40339S [Aspergillus puulaauensis]BCS23895.1 hypothetical protein APUU_40339S [Aspergillus puulaauensis]
MTETHPKTIAHPPSSLPPLPTGTKPSHNHKRNKSSTSSTHSNGSSNSGGSGSSGRCWDWILVPGNMHYAKNRSSFRTYRRAPGKINKNRVLGVGTVELKVQRAPDDQRPNTLVLEDVLHLPNAVCNGLCVGKYREGNPGDGMEVAGGEGCRCQVWREGDGDSHGEGEGENEQEHGHGHGEALWYGEEYHGCSRVVLWGDPQGSSGLGDADADAVELPGVDASTEELDTLYTRVKDRSLV